MTAANVTDRTHSLVALGGAIYAARQSGLYRIPAAGEAQNLFRAWLPDRETPALALAIDAGCGLMLAGIQGGVARSMDGGANWEAIKLRAPAPLVTCLAAAPGVADGGCILAGTFEDGVFRSADGGATWQAVNHGLFDHSVYALALSPRFAEDGLVYAGTGSGVYASQNGGRLWQDLIMPAGGETALSLALADSGALYAGTESHGLLCSQDGGDSWETLRKTYGAVNSLALARDGTIIAQMDDRVLRSKDGGASWNELVGDGVECLSLDGESLVLAMSDGSIRRADY
ncbi:MAG: hypothetical protein F4X02_05055 [Chloroflexi bacterium]|nr:hypothetical protein [Chloroflexota bacterium]